MSGPHLRLIALVGLIVPRRLRADWRQEWEAELQCREMLLADWDRLDRRHKFDLLRRSTSAFWDAVWLQRRRLEDDMFQDLRFGARLLLKNPTFTLIAVVTLALGIGANTAIFTLVDKILIRPLPVERPDQLVTFSTDAGGAPAIVSYPRYTDLRDGNGVLSGLLAYTQRPFSVGDGVRNERVIGQMVSGNYFTVLSVQPALGRFFLPEDDRTPGTHPVAVIGHALWQRRFAADPAVVGKKITVNAHDYTVIGVAPAEFVGTTRGTVTDLYVPAMMQPVVMGTDSYLERRTAGWLQLFGRLKPGVTREQAQAALGLLPDEAGAIPGKKDTWRLGAPKNQILLLDGSRGYMDRVTDLSLPLKLLMGVVGFVLLIACANVANLLLARASVRQKEIAVRRAIGASRLRIVRQLLTESTILAVLGGCGGLLIAYRVTGVLLRFQEQTNFVPRTFDGSLDGRTLAFTLGLSVLTGTLFSLAPARHASKPDVLSALKAETPAGLPRWSLRHLLVVAQVALSLVVLIGAGLCVKSLRALQEIEPGFQPAKVLTASFDLGMNGYDEARARKFIPELSERIARLPGVEGVSLAHIVAFSDSFWVSGATIDGYVPQPGERLAFDFNAVGPAYFKTIGTPLVSGREFTDADTADAQRVIVVNETVAQHYWPGQDPVGKRTSRGVIVGVVKDTREKGLIEMPHRTIYLPLLQSYSPDLTLHVRAATDPRALVAALRGELQSMDPTLAIYNVRTLEEQKDGSLYTERLAAALLTLFGVLALTLAAVGIYGVLSYSVTARTREIGIRLTQGAQPLDLLTLVVRQGMALTVVGLVIGVGASYALTRVLQGLLFGVSATDPMTFVVIPLLLAGVALLACWVPARRATRMSPMVALRYEE